MAINNEDLFELSYFKGLKTKHIFDSLTGAVSREYALGYIKSLTKSKTPYLLHLVDIDNFKLVNDELGHKTGDLILKKVVETILEITKNTSIIGRYGGDEFLIITPNISDYNEVWKYTKTVFEYVRNKNIPSALGSTITLTAGAACYPKDFVEFDQLFSKIDKALYRGKQKGRNCFIIYDEEKHKNIDVNNTNEQLTDIFDHVYSVLMNNNTLQNRMEEITRYIGDIYNLSFYKINNDNSITTLYSKENINLPNINPEYNEKILKNKKNFLINDYSILKDTDINYHTYCWDNNIKALATFKLEAYGIDYGYLYIVHYHMKRIWQREDKILFSYLAKILSLVLHNENK